MLIPLVRIVPDRSASYIYHSGSSFLGSPEQLSSVSSLLTSSWLRWFVLRRLYLRELPDVHLFVVPH